MGYIISIIMLDVKYNEKDMKKEIIIILISIFISFLVALAGSYNGFYINESPIIFHCFLITYTIQLVVFIPSYICTTEKFFDLTGMITYLTIMIYILIHQKKL